MDTVKLAAVHAAWDLIVSEIPHSPIFA